MKQEGGTHKKDSNALLDDDDNDGNNNNIIMTSAVVAHAEANNRRGDGYNNNNSMSDDAGYNLYHPGLTFHHAGSDGYLGHQPYGYPPLTTSHQHQPSSHPASRSYYHHHHQDYHPYEYDGGYSTTTAAQYNMSAHHLHHSPPPPQHYHHHPAQLQHVYYGSWPNNSPAPPPPSIIQHHQHQHRQQVHYHGSYPPTTSAMLPPPPPPHRAAAKNQRRNSSSYARKNNNKSPDQQQHYGGGGGNGGGASPLELNAAPFRVEDANLASALIYVKRNPNATLFDVEAIIPDIAKAGETGSHFLQKRLKLGTVEEGRLCLTVALSNIEDLWGDQFGNFLLQGIFEHGSDEMKKELMEAVYGQDVIALSLHMHGCRVIQKAIRSLDCEDVCELIKQFHDKVLAFIHDPHGNHVIQRCIQVMSRLAKSASNSGDPDLASSLSDKMQFIVDDIVSNAESLSTHRYGCRVVQRAMEYCVRSQKNAVLERVVACREKLVVDQYGNYVVQQVFLATASEEYQEAILETLTMEDSLLTHSKHKYASNVIEAVLAHGRHEHKEKLLEEMLKDTRGDDDGGYCCVIEMSKDPIANYVVNKAIEVSDVNQKEKLFEIISASRPELSKSSYAKYVLQQMDKHDK